MKEIFPCVRHCVDRAGRVRTSMLWDKDADGHPQPVAWLARTEREKKRLQKKERYFSSRLKRVEKNLAADPLHDEIGCTSRCLPVILTRRQV